MTPAVRRLLREHDLSPGPDRRDRRRRPDHARGRPRGRRVDPDRRARPGRCPGPERRPSRSRVAPAAKAPSGGAIAFPDGADEVLLPMTQMRKGIAAQMTRALAVPHAYVHMEVDASGLVRAREGAKREYQAREGISLSYVPFVIKADGRGAQALSRRSTPTGPRTASWPSAGSTWASPSPSTTACSCPVVRDVDQLSISGLNRAIADVAARARAGKLKLDDYGGSTFTIDNTGWFGSNLTMPIINVPEVAILTMEAITKRPVVRETAEGDVIAIRPVMNMVLAIDHRANDGAQAAAFLRDDQGLARGRRAGHAGLLTPMRIVVTGGAGFIGGSVVRQLAARGDQVVALVRDPGEGRRTSPARTSSSSRATCRTSRASTEHAARRRRA